MRIHLKNNDIGLYDIDNNYRKYLSKHDSKVSLKIGRRFMEIIVGLKDYTYFIPLTSKPLRDNGKRRNTRTTVEIYDESKKIIAALLINNMIPVPEGAYRKIDFEKEKYRDYLKS